ncbi:MAG: hypothetical protein R8G01_13860 [Ilumatobacteraceae bacterium]|nr:hypothetical protein [Ilumatobacteraceae bacterium]
MPRRRPPEQQRAHNPLGPSAVFGLEAGREHARRRQRRSQFKDKVFGAAGAIVAMAVVASVAYVGYTIYTEQQASDRLETEQRQAELDRQGSGNDLRDAIDELENSPAWNGPGNPTFGVGERPDENRIEVTPPPTVPDSGG